MLVDAEAFRALGFHPACVVAAITVQDTERVWRVMGVDPGLMKEQAEAVFKDLDVAAVKVGVLWSRENVEATAKLLQSRLDLPRVVDPVLRAKRGERLIEEEALDTLIKKLLPVASVATPNAEEASELTGVEVRSEEGVEEALRALNKMGVEAPVVKGWVRSGVAVDAVLLKGRVHFLEAEALGEVRGSGCAFSAALAAYLARGLSVLDALREARRFTRKVLRAAPRVGGGFPVADPATWLSLAEEKLRTLEEARRGVSLLEKHPELAQLMPEVRMNLAVAPMSAEEPGDVVGVEGRITVVGGSLRASGHPWFGASSHLARLLLAVRRRLPAIKAALNIKYSPEVLEACRRAGLKLARFDRREEPREVKEVEGASMEWGVERALRSVEGEVDAIYDEGAEGKEAMIRLLGRDVEEVVEKAVKVVEQLGKGF